MANYFMPSEIARLILGYLIERGLSKTMKIFLQECPDLAEYYQVMKTGRVPPTTIVGQSLLDILNEFAELKLKAVRSGQVMVPTVTATECSSKEKDTIICAKEQVEEAIKRQRSLWRDQKARQKERERQQGTATLASDSVGCSTSISFCGDHVSTEDVPVSTPGSVDIPDRASIPASSEVTCPETKPASASSHVTGPEYITLSVPTHVGGPDIDSVSVASHVTNPQQTDTEHVDSAAAITEVEMMPDIQTDIPDLPAAQTGMDTQVQLVLEDKHAAGPSHEKIAAEENADLLDFLLEDTNFHQKLAENINKVLLEYDPSQSKNKVGILSEANNKDLASMISKGFTINQIIERTESDPTFQNFLQLFQQGTAVPLCHFDVPVINIPSEVTTGQPGNTSLPTAGKPESSQAPPHSCKSASIEPVDYQGDVSAVASACSVTFQPTNLLLADSEQTTPLNPCDAEKLDEEVPCDIETLGISETPQVVPSPILKQLETSSKDYTVIEKFGSQNLTDLQPLSSLQLMTSGFSEKCSTSDLNCVPDLVISSESTEDKKSRSKFKSSYIDAEKLTTQHSVVLTNENSLTVFSLIEKSIAEMNGEEFIHRSQRNSPFSQTAGSVDTHSYSSGGNRNEGSEHSSTVVVCDNTSRSVICCDDVNNPVDSHERTEKCHGSNFQTGSNDIEKSASISLNICATQNTSAVLTETTVTENVEAFQVVSATHTRTSDPDKRVVLCNTALPACDKSSELHPDYDNNPGENGLNSANLCHNDYIEGKIDQHGTDIGGNSHVCLAAVSSYIGTDTNVIQEERHAGQAVMDTHETCVEVSGLKILCIEPEASPGLLKFSKKNKTNSTQSPNKKNCDNSSNSVCEENKQCSRNDDQNCTLVADGPIVRETDNMDDVEDRETDARKACLSEKELWVDNPECFYMSPPLRKPGRLQPAMTHCHTKKTCVNTQTEVKRSQSLCDSSASSTFLDGQITTAGGNSPSTFKKHPIITSPPYFPLNLTDNKTDKQLPASIDPQTSCCSLPANVSLPGSPNFPQSCNSSIKQAPQMTPPHGKQLPTNSTTEEGQVQPKTVKRRVIAFHSEHSPFIPDHCKKNPSRRIVPKEVDYSTPSPLQDCPSSPMSYMVDACLSQPNSPLNSKESVMRPMSSGKTLPPLNGHIKINQRSTEASCHNEKSSSCSAQSHTTEGQQKVNTPEVCFSHLDKLGIKLPPSPSKRKPRRINPVQLSSLNKDWAGVTRSNSFVPHGGYSPVVDESRIVSSTSDITTSSEEEAFRQLKSLLSSSYSKPQPRQEITSTDQKTGMSRPKSHNKHKGRGKKTSPVKENAVLTTTSEANDIKMSKENVHGGSDYASAKGAHTLAESVPSCEDSVNQACNTDSGSMKEQPTVNLPDSKGILPVKSSVYKVQCLHNAAQPSVSPCSHDSDMSFAPVGIMECYPSKGDQQVQKIDNGRMATTSISSSSLVTVCESTQNILCMTESKGGSSKETRNTLNASGELCDYQNDIRGDAKVCAKTHKREQMDTEQTGAHSGLTVVDVDGVSLNCTSQGKSVDADGHCMVISVKKPTDSMETNAVDLVSNVTAYSNTPALPTISIVANNAENKTCILSTSMVKSLSSALSASEEHITTSADPCVSVGRHVTQPQLEPCGQHKHHDSGGCSPSAPASNSALNVTDSVTDAVFSLLSLCSSVDSKMATNIVSHADENISGKVDTDPALLTNKPPISNSKLSGQCPTSVSVPLRSSLMPVPTLSSDVSLPSFISSSLRLAHDIELSCEMPTNYSSPIKHCNNNVAGQDAAMNSENEQEVEINKERLRPCSPSSISLLSRAMADSGIPFDGSDLTLPDTWASAGEGASHTLPVPPVRIPTPDVIAAVCEHIYSGVKKGRKPRSTAKKPDFRNVARILPNFGMQNFQFADNKRVEDPGLSDSFVKILPRASDAVLKPQVTGIQPQSSLLGQIQVIPSANGSIIIIPPGLEGIIQTLLSENNEPGPQVSHMANNMPGPHIENKMPGPQELHKTDNLPVGGECGKLNMKSAKSLKSRSCLRNRKLSSPSTNKLNQSSAGLTTSIDEEEERTSDSFSSSDEVPLSRISKFTCVRKIAVRRKIDFTHLRRPKKGRKTKAKKSKFKAHVDDCVRPGKQGPSSDVVVATDIKGGKSVSCGRSPRSKHTLKNITSEQTEAACEVERQSKDCVVQRDMSDGICEINRLDNDFVQSDRSDKRKVSCGVQKNQNGCPGQSERAKSMTTGVCDDNTRSNNCADRKDRTKDVCEAKKSGTYDVVTGDKTPGVCEAKKSGTYDVVTSDKTPGVCDDITRSNNAHQKDKKGVCKVEKSGTNDVENSNTANLEVEYNRGSQMIISCKITDKMAHDLNEQGDHTMPVSEENTEKSSGGKRLHLGDKSAEISSNKDVSSREGTKANNSSITAGKSAVSSLPALTELMHDKSKSQWSRDLEDVILISDTEEIGMCVDTSEQSAGISVHEHNRLVLSVKSPDVLKPVKNNSTVKAAQINKTPAAIVNTVTDFVENKIALSSLDSQNTVSVSGTVISEVKSTHSKGTDSSKLKSTHTKGTDSSEVKSTHSKGTGSSEVKATHSKGTGSSEVKATHSKGTGSSEGKSTHSKGTGSSEGKSTHSKDTGSSEVKDTHSKGTGSSEGKSTHSKDTGSLKVKSTHPENGKRRHKEANADVDMPDSKKIKLQMLFDKRDIKEHVDRPASVFKKIKLQVSSDELDIRDHHLCASQKSVRMVVDYRSGEKIVAGNLPGGNSDVLITAEVEQEKLQSYSLQVNSQLKSKMKSAVKQNSSKIDKNVCINSTPVNKCTNKSGTAQALGKKLETNNKISPKLGGCQYVGSVPVGSLFSLLGTMGLKGKQSTQPSLLPVGGSVSRSPKKPQHKCTDNPYAARNSHGHVTSSSTQTRYTADPSEKAIPEYQKHRTSGDPNVSGISRDRASSQNRKDNNSTVSIGDIGKAIPEHQKHRTTSDPSVSGTSRDRSSSQNRKYNDSAISAGDVGKAIVEHQKHRTVGDPSVSGISRDRSSTPNRKDSNSTVSTGNIGKAIPEHQKHRTTSDPSVSGTSRDRSSSQNKKRNNNSTVSTGDVGKAIQEHQKHRITSDPSVSGTSRDRSSTPNRKDSNSTVSTGNIAKAIPEHQKHRTTSDPSVSGTSRDRSSSQNRKYNNSTVSTGNIGKAIPEHQKHRTTSDPSVSGTSRGTSSQNRKDSNSTVSTGDIGEGKRPDFQTKQKTCNGGKEADTTSIVEVDCVSDSGYDNETQDAVSALELCMRESADESTDDFHNQPGTLFEVSSQHNIDQSAVAILEDLICQMSNTSAHAKKLQPCDLNDTSPIKLHLPPKKRLSSEFIVSGTVSAQFHHDQNPSVLPASDPVLSLNNEKASQSHASSVRPSKHLQDSSEPETVAVSAYVETGAVHHEPLTENVLLSTQPPTSLDHTSQTDPLATEVRGKTSPIPLSHEEVIALSEELNVQMLHQNLSVHNNIVNTSSYCEVNKEQSPLSSSSLREQHRQRSFSSSVASSDQINPKERGYNAAVCEPTLELSPVDKTEPCAASERSVALQTACIPSADPTKLDETHPISRLTARSKVDKLLRKLHKKNKTKHL